jgi:ferredoxin
MAISRRLALKALIAGGTAAASTALGGRADAAETPPHADAVGLLYDTTLCIGCKACVAACAEANGLQPDTAWSGGLWQAPLDLNANTKNIIKYYEDGSERAFVKRQCMHCLDPACVNACMLGALKKDTLGIVSYDPSRNGLSEPARVNDPRPVSRNSPPQMVPSSP